VPLTFFYWKEIMPRLKLTEPGFTNMSGLLHDVEFFVGWSAPLAPATIRRLGNIIRADVYDDAGTTRIGEAGEAAWMTGDRGPDTKPTLPAGVDDDTIFPEPDPEVPEEDPENP